MTTLSNAPLESVGEALVPTVKTYCMPHSVYPRDAPLQYVHVSISHGKAGEIGHACALQIRRHMYPNAHQFIESLDNDSLDMYEFVTTVFDKSGNLRSDLMEDDYLKGTGVWGRELDNGGTLLYVKSVRVKEEVTVPWTIQRIPKLIICLPV